MNHLSNFFASDCAVHILAYRYTLVRLIGVWRTFPFQGGYYGVSPVFPTLHAFKRKRGMTELEVDLAPHKRYG